MSDKVINRMKQSSEGVGPPPAAPVPAPSAEHLLPAVQPPPPSILPTTPTLPQEATSMPPTVEPVKLTHPPPVKFHSLTPSAVSPPPPSETKPPPQTSPASAPPSTSSPVEPSPPDAELLPPPPSELEHPSTPPAAEPLFKSVETAPSEPSPVPSEHVTPSAVEPAAVDPAVFKSPSTKVFQPSPTVKADAIAPHGPADSAPVEALTPQAEPPVLPIVVPAIDSACPCELVPAPPPPESTHCVELAVIPAGAPVGEPMEPASPPPPDPVPPAEEPTQSPSLPPVPTEPLPAAGRFVPEDKRDGKTLTCLNNEAESNMQYHTYNDCEAAEGKWFSHKLNVHMQFCLFLPKC